MDGSPLLFLSYLTSSLAELWCFILILSSDRTKERFCSPVYWYRCSNKSNAVNLLQHCYNSQKNLNLALTHCTLYWIRSEENTTEDCVALLISIGALEIPFCFVKDKKWYTHLLMVVSLNSKELASLTQAEHPTRRHYRLDSARVTLCSFSKICQQYLWNR